MAAVSVGATKYGGQERTIDQIQTSALVLGMNVIGNGSFDEMGHFGVSAQRPAKDDEYAVKQCRNMAKAIMKSLK
jgi:multimeric flavodoxin WrbA